MKRDDFERVLRELIRREPFAPFVVERVDGTLVRVEHRSVAFGGGAASYLTPEYDLVEFACENVQAIHAAVREGTP
jgi:hypothetical protein